MIDLESATIDGVAVTGPLAYWRTGHGAAGHGAKGA